MKLKISTCFILLILCLPACSSYQKHFGFKHITDETKKRISQDLVWRGNSKEDKEVEERISVLLKEPLTASDVIQIALLNNFELQAKYQNLGLSQAELVQAGLLTNPILSSERRFPGKAFEFDVTQNFISIALLPMKKQMAKHEFEAAKLDLVQEVLSHAFMAKESFINYQSLENQIELMFEKNAGINAARKAARELRRAGNVTELELQTYEQLAAEAYLELLKMRTEEVKLREDLNIAMGLTGEQINWSTNKRITPIPSEESLAENLEMIAIGNRADLLSLNQQLAARMQQVGITNIESYIPELTVTSHYEKEPDGKSSTGPSFEFPIPIFNFGGAKRAAVKTILERAKDQYRALEVRIRAEVRSTQARMELARTRAEYLNTYTLPLQGKRLVQAQLQYNGMLIGVFDLIKFKSEKIETQMQGVEALRDYWLARTSLEKALGKELH